MVKFKEIQFLVKGKIVFSMKDCTLPEALERGKEFKAIDNYAAIISCVYY